MSTKRVLVVEDESDIGEVIQICLELLEDWEVLIAATGPEGLALAGRADLDLILLDVMLPGLDGVATFAKLQANPRLRLIPVIFLTAKVQIGEQKRLANLGAVGVIPKPFDPLKLPTQIKGLLGW